MFEYLRFTLFTRGLSSSKILQHSAVAQVFKEAIACDGILNPDFRNDKELKVALEKIWRNGWLHTETSNNDIVYVFASKIHHWWVRIPFYFTSIAYKTWFQVLRLPPLRGNAFRQNKL